MLSLPDFTEKKIIFIQVRGDLENCLQLHNHNIRYRADGVNLHQISCHLVSCIFIIGQTSITTTLIKTLKELGISVFLLSPSLKSYAEIISTAEGNYALRACQYRMSDDLALQMGKNLIENKISNQINLAKEYHRDLPLSISSVTGAADIQQLLGVEGYAAKVYFHQVFSDYNWFRRAPTTKEDIPNLLLDVGYNMLFNFTDSVSRIFGFDTYKGFYHQLYFQRKSLSCDLMEPMRVLIDKSLIKAYNLKQINEGDFIFTNGAFQFNHPSLYRKYADIFLYTIHTYRDEIFTYIHDNYRYIMCPNKYDLPYFAYKP